MNSSSLHPDSKKKKVAHDSVWRPSRHWWRQGEQGPPWTTPDTARKRTSRATRAQALQHQRLLQSDHI